MRFGNRHSNVKIELRIGDKEIEEGFVTKFLGVLMDNKLNWKEHICMIKSKLAKSNAIIYRANKYLDTFFFKKIEECVKVNNIQMYIKKPSNS